MAHKSSEGVGLRSIYGFSALLTIAILAVAGFSSGLEALFPIVVLALLEITFSFDNAVLNSQLLGKMSRAWQQVFLTVGIAIAVFGVRFLLPISLVSVTTNNTVAAVFDLALHHPTEYAHQLEKGYHTIAAFGGVFLLMIGLRFFGEKRKVKWLHRLESPIGEFNQPWWVVGLGAAIATLAIWFVLAPGEKSPLLGAIFGAATFIVIKGLGELMTHRTPNKKGPATGIHALTLFLYLELLDASFSFDGVVAAFAITKDIVLIAAGLGIGALFVRSMTVHLMQDGTIGKFRYLIHGAHYAVLLLGILMLASIRIHLPEVVTGLAGIVILALAIFSSVRDQR